MVTTAVDTNVLLSLLQGEKAADLDALERALESAAESGELIISPPVYCELIAEPARNERFVTTFLEDTRIRVEWAMPNDLWRLAGRAYGGYIERRRSQKNSQRNSQQNDEGPRRILADFIIGAHASYHQTRLLTFDQKMYRAAFPKLTVISP